MMSGVSAGTAALGKYYKIGFLANPIINGIAAGVPSGLISAETTSLSQSGRFTLDGKDLMKSVYEMSVLGGVFSGGAVAGGKVHDAFLVGRQDCLRSIAMRLTDQLPTDWKFFAAME